MPLIAELLARRVRTDGPAPLVTCYDLADGSRVELSATTTANWVAKTSGFLTDELLLEPGAAVELQVAVEHPGHWMALVWALACWQTGAVATVGRPGDAQVVVTGPDVGDLRSRLGADVEVVACSLHPLGLGLASPPPGVVDFATEVRGQPDVWVGAPVAPDAPAWHDGERSLSQQDLLDGGPSVARRVVVPASEPWATVREALVVPLRDGGSSVVVSGAADGPRLARMVDDERVDAVLP
ncbi:TIGR03089 family protein [Microlunatus flavus]|uniref:TIGR03089 family protein n=1 Tax=Microlunatus flavus TaxID=1036181 RepID=A0A1H9CH40_9ACTN|nr:TIGR03089 family protein [Microlunatus flavus]SEQ00535.1 TIGR03089 family protein [Microlunatus flavus]